MHDSLVKIIYMLNPWLQEPRLPIVDEQRYVQRMQTDMLLLPDWDRMCLLLVGPRQSGKTTLGKFISQTLIQQGKFESLLYLNCDFLEIRQWLSSPTFIQEAFETFILKHPIVFIDEVQRIENAGLLLKSITDLQLPIKLIASGSSQLEIKSDVQEYLTGRHLEARIFPLSSTEINKIDESMLIYGTYPNVILSARREVILQQLYKDYIDKDIIEILKIGKPDVMQKLITLLAHSAGQLVNYNQLATDCRISIPTVQHYCTILEKTYVIAQIKPFVGNKRKEITSNPIYYFVDNGFRNQALRQFSSIDNRNDVGLLIENFVFQEILKYKANIFDDFDIYYWRTQSGAEVDFVLYKNTQNFIPIEVKYRTMRKYNISRSFRSFLEAYVPKIGVIITKDFNGKLILPEYDNCEVYFVSLQKLNILFDLLKKL